MLIINNECYVNGEIVFINNGRMQGIRGPLVGVKEEEKLALIRIGTVTSEVEFDYIERVELDRPRLYAKTSVSPDGKSLIFHHMVSGTSFDDVIERHGEEFGYMEIDEVDGYDVILQK
jgi:hypothetical protein